jgi:hypothetical protein
MAKLTSFIICESINNMPAANNMDVVPTLVAPQVALRPQYVPGSFSFGVAVGINEIDLQMVNRVRFTIKSPENVLLQDSGVTELPVAPQDPALPAQYQGFMMCIDIRNLAIPCEGDYTFSFFLNDECVGDQTIPIYKRVM